MHCNKMFAMHLILFYDIPMIHYEIGDICMNPKNFIPVSHQHTICRKLGFLLLILLFVGPALVLPTLSHSSHSIQIGALTLQSASLCGILSCIELIAMVCFVVVFHKLGLYMAIMLSTISISTCLIPIIKVHKLNSIAGIVLNALGILICILFHHNRISLNEKQESLHKLAYFDYLTGLPNRRNTVDTMNELCKSNRSFWTVVIDINNFKRVNDVVGHQKGDILLTHMVERWFSFTNQNDFLGRIDGDEFAILITRNLSEDELHNYIDELRTCLCNHSLLIGDFANMHSHSEAFIAPSVLLSASFGVVRYPDHGTNAEELLQFADNALAISKELGPNTVSYFDKTMYEKLVENTLLESALSYSLKNEECFLQFQPQYTANGKKLRGFETLVRWNSKEFGFIPPSVFIPLAEKNGFILPLGEWVLKTALTEFNSLLDRYGSDITLSINLSVIQILNVNFMPMLCRILAETGFPASQLELEITESIFISDKDEVARILNQIKALGITIALDDFGTRYSSLSYLKDLPLDIIKIDKSFVDAILEDTKKAQLVDTILAIAKQMDYQVVAEGVETTKQLSYLSHRSCDYIQGYLWGKPVPLEQAEQLLMECEEQIS